MGRREEKLVEVAESIGGDHVSYAVADVGLAEDTRRYVAEAVARYGGLDVLVSNAGIEGPVHLVEDHSEADFDEIVATNLRGVWLSYKHAFPELRSRGGGSIVLTSSIGGFVGFPTLSAYVATKHAVIGLAKCFALEGAPYGIRVNAVSPGFIETDMFHGLTTKFAPVAGVDRQAVYDMLAARVPLKRTGTSEEIARLNLFLACSDSSYTTGSTFVADGGVLAGVL